MSSRFQDPHDILQCLFKHILGKNTQIEICPLRKEKSGTSIKYNSLLLAVKVSQKTIFELHCDYVVAGKFFKSGHQTPLGFKLKASGLVTLCDKRYLKKSV